MITEREKELLLGLAMNAAGPPSGLLGFVLNPKSMEILAVVIDGLDVTILRTDGSAAGSGRFEADEDDYASRKTGLSRVHVAEKDDVVIGSGDGTAIYSAMTLAAHAFYVADARSSVRPGEVGDGVCSFHCEGMWGRTASASSWWGVAVKKRGMATRRVFRSSRLGRCVVDSYEYADATRLGLVLMAAEGASSGLSVDLLADPALLIGKLSITGKAAARNCLAANWKAMASRCREGVGPLVDLFADALLSDGLATKSEIKSMYDAERSGIVSRARKTKSRRPQKR